MLRYCAITPALSRRRCSRPAYSSVLTAKFGQQVEIHLKLSKFAVKMDLALLTLLNKYGFLELQTMASLVRAIPPSMPEANIMQAFWTAFPQESSLVVLLSDLKLVHSLNIPRPMDFTHRFLGPPIVQCLNGCRGKRGAVGMDVRDLVPHQTPRQVRIYDLSRVTVQGLEHQLRCTGCKSRYGLFWYYDPNRGRIFYEDKPALLRVSEEVYWTRDLTTFMHNSILHTHCTFEAFAEAVRTTFAFPAEFNRRMVSDAFYISGIEDEIRDLAAPFYFTTREIITPAVIAFLERARDHQLYTHQCSPRGLERGGLFLYIFDGIWDLAFRHCSMPMKAEFFRADAPATESNRTTELYASELQELPSATQTVIRANGRDCSNPRAVAPWCRKNLGEKKKAGCWSRGYLMLAEGCGNINALQPLYRCNFDRLKAHQEPLPACFPSEYQDMWSHVTKIIDGLHLQNHKQERCKIDYNPAKFIEVHPDKHEANTMAAEQTFSWMGKYKKQIASIPKTRQLFYLHRLVKHRNKYSAA